MIPRLVKELGYSEADAQMVVREAKRMLYLRASGARTVSPSLKVDDGWHTMLMFTRFYKDFAKFIGGFVHHNPTPPRNGDEQSKGDSEAYAYTKQAYREILGVEPDARWWP